MRGGVLVREIGGEPADVTSPAGIYMPPQSRPEYTKYEVVAVGPPMILQGVGEVPSMVKRGDTVIMARMGKARKPGRFVKLDDEDELVLVGEEAIWAVVDGGMP